MLRLRPYKKCDAAQIVSWIKDEVSFRKWCADRYESYPIGPEDMNAHYAATEDGDTFFPMTAFDENGVVGHMIMRFTNKEKTDLRFGFVIVDDSKRGKGYGREMIGLAMKYAFEILKVKKITISVFDNNESAYKCYISSGFRDTGEAQSCQILGQEWRCIELEVSKG